MLNCWNEGSLGAHIGCHQLCSACRATSWVSISIPYQNTSDPIRDIVHGVLEDRPEKRNRTFKQILVLSLPVNHRCPYREVSLFP